MYQALGFAAPRQIPSTPIVDVPSNKVYGGVTNQLKDDGVAKESLQDESARDIDNIKSKLESLFLEFPKFPFFDSDFGSDLDSSYSFLIEGVEWLNLAIDLAIKDDNYSLPVEAGRISKDSASDIVNEAQSVRGLNISCEEHFLSAKAKFKASREETTRAFNNESLSLENRIVASALRVAARTLESGLQDPEIAIACCLVALEELHGLPQIQDMFSVFLKGGFKSGFKREEQLENIMSVLFMNHALFDFASNRGSEYPNVFTWPGIQLEDRKVNPILHANEILWKTSRSEEFSRQLSRTVFDRRRWVHPSAVNSRGEVVLFEKGEIRVILTTGECKHVVLREPTGIIARDIKATAVDCNGKVYALSFVEALDGNNVQANFVLYVFDESYYELKHETTLDFLQADGNQAVIITVNKNDNIIMIQGGDNHVYIFNSKGELEFQFKRDSSEAYSLSTTKNNDIMVPSDDHCSVCVYTIEGVSKSPFKVPEGHKIEQVAFHHGISKVIVLTSVKELWRPSLLCYSETGELENSEVFNKDGLLGQVRIAGHCSGAFVVLSRDSISFL